MGLEILILPVVVVIVLSGIAAGIALGAQIRKWKR